MKKVLKVISSMKFGIILLVAIGVLCVVATATDTEEIYSGWYFVALFALLALNLFFCSIVRVNKIKVWKKNLLDRAIKEKSNVPTNDSEKWLKSHGFKKQGEVYIKNSIGLTGTFFTHLGMLLLTIAGAIILSFTTYTDYVVHIDESLTLDDGSILTVDAFSLENSEEDVEYKSSVTVTQVDGSEKKYDILVNYPISFGKYKVYQQNYVYSAVVGVKTEEGEEEIVYLDEAAFLSLEDYSDTTTPKNGIYYVSMFTNVIEEDEETKVTRSGDVINPAYEVNVIDQGNVQVGLVYPNTTLTVGGVSYTFYEPTVNPGFRIKERQDWAMVLLYASFAIMVLGLYACFFCITEAAAVKEDGICVVSQKNNNERIMFYQKELESKEK